MSYVLGIDVSKATLDVALSETNKRYQEASFRNDTPGHEQLRKWLVRQGVESLHVCLEATGRYGDEVACVLHAEGYVVSLVNPARIHAYGKSKLRRHKNDRLDARLIADFCFTQQPDAWTPPSENQRVLQELTRELETLKRDKTRKRNKLGSGIVAQPVRDSLERQIASINAEIAQLKKEIDQLTQSDAVLQEDMALLQSIPGIGQVTAACFLAEVDVSRFTQAAQVAAYAGLVPREFSSGSSVHKRARLSKIGNRRIRSALYLPALSAARFNPIIRALVQRMEAKGKKKMTIVGAVMRKLVHLAFGVLKTRKPFDPHYIPVGA